MDDFVVWLPFDGVGDWFDSGVAGGDEYEVCELSPRRLRRLRLRRREDVAIAMRDDSGRREEAATTRPLGKVVAAKDEPTLPAPMMPILRWFLDNFRCEY